MPESCDCGFQEYLKNRNREAEIERELEKGRITGPLRAGQIEMMTCVMIKSVTAG